LPVAIQFPKQSLKTFFLFTGKRSSAFFYLFSFNNIEGLEYILDFVIFHPEQFSLEVKTCGL